MKRAYRVLGGMAVLAVIAAGCGDDDDAASGDGTEAYCELARTLDEKEDFPTVAQLEEIRELAPEEIADEVDLAADKIIAALDTDTPEEVFDDPELTEAFEVIEPFEEEQCGIDNGGEEFEIAAEDAAYCEIAQTLEDQEDFPTTEQLEQYRDAAPDEIAAPVKVVVDAFLAAGDDPFAAFEAPGVDEAFEGQIEPFEEERCGIEREDEEDQDPSVTQLDPAATRIDVRATDYAFELSASPTAGRTSFVMTNEGAERHVMALFRIAEGSTLDDVIDEQGDGDSVEEEWESDIVTNGKETVLTADLTPGSYGLICYIETEAGPHFMLGMREEFTIA